MKLAAVIALNRFCFAMNLDEEVRKGYTISAEMKKVWKIQLDLLKMLLQVCEQHQLRIWVEGGTLLGAVREQGYIPWDDDIDMAMLREDYDKLVEVAPQAFKHPFFFQCGYTERIYPRGHAQLRMDGTTAILPHPAFLDTHQGIFIDIFPYDYMPDGKKELTELIKKRNEMMAKLEHFSFFDILHPVRSFLYLIKRDSFQKEYRKFEDIFRAYSACNCSSVCCLSFIADTDHYLRDIKWYDSTIWMPFEDIQVPVPSGYHYILSKQYGDYMTPLKLGSNHGGFWKLDADTSYTTYLPELKEYVASRVNNRRKERIQRFLKRIRSKFFYA